MRIDILTLFPEMFAPLQTSLIGKAVENQSFELNIIDISLMPSFSAVAARQSPASSVKPVFKPVA